jgi:predicted Rossmann-fold nucleotide-binding protein
MGGRDFWGQLGDFMRNTMLPAGVISPQDVDFIHPAESPEEAIEFIQNSRIGTLSTTGAES